MMSPCMIGVTFDGKWRGFHSDIFGAGCSPGRDPSPHLYVAAGIAQFQSEVCRVPEPSKLPAKIKFPTAVRVAGIL